MFGVNTFGFRFSAARTLTVLVVRIDRRMTGSTLLGYLAGVLLTLDGLNFVQSRTSMSTSSCASGSWRGLYAAVVLVVLTVLWEVGPYAGEASRGPVWVIYARRGGVGACVNRSRSGRPGGFGRINLKVSASRRPGEARGPRSPGPGD